MVTVSLVLEDSDTPLRIELDEGAAALVGRDPDPAMLPEELREAIDEAEVRLVSERLERLEWVSRNHLLLHARAGGTFVTDAQSRSGTWLRLPAAEPVRLPGELGITLRLSPDASEARRQEGPRRAEWSTQEEFAPSVLAAVRRWLVEVGLEAEVAIGADAAPATAGEERIPLGDGHQLRVRRGPARDTEQHPWLQTLDRLHRYVGAEDARYRRRRGHDDDLILASPSYCAAHDQIAEAAAWRNRVVILGPTGAGKERMAQCYHLHSQQHQGPYVTINCALFTADLIEARLFGTRKGAFTGAENRRGLIDEAEGGTLFLDEVGQMPLAVQSRFLRFLDSGRFRALGAGEDRIANVQIVCATNQPLHRPAWRQGRFMDDLWHRLAVQVVPIEPLRDRPEDVQAFLKRRVPPGAKLPLWELLSPEARRVVLGAPLDGNFRELDHLVRRLPGDRARGSIDAQACRAALLGPDPAKPLGPDDKPTPAARPDSNRTPSVVPAGPAAAPVMEMAADRWQRISALAAEAFAADHGHSPSTWGELQTFNERYLKPVFVAHCSGLAGLAAMPVDLNYSQLARDLFIADGKTAKTHVVRYFERFARGRAEG